MFDSIFTTYITGNFQCCIVHKLGLELGRLEMVASLVVKPTFHSEHYTFRKTVSIPWALLISSGIAHSSGTALNCIPLPVH